jgi:AraC-like DNA-binding protein
MRVVGLGQIHFWEGGSIWAGVSLGGTGEHAHHAIQISCGLKGPVSVLGPGGAGVVEAAIVVVPSNLPHAFDGEGRITVTLHCEPESTIGRALARRFGGDRVVAVSDELAASAVERIWRAYSAEQPDDAFVAACRDALNDLAALEPAPQTVDRRVLGAVAEVRRRLGGEITLAAVAKAVHLSPGRFRHLFVTETGVPFRRYVLWQRLQRALEAGVTGASWTDAAHAASFADAAHLTRTFRRMLGLNPTALVIERDREATIAKHDTAREPAHRSRGAAAAETRRPRSRRSADA